MDLSGKEPHRQLRMCEMAALGNLGGVMVSTLAQNARDVGSVPTLRAMLPFSTPLPP